MVGVANGGQVSVRMCGFQKGLWVSVRIVGFNKDMCFSKDWWVYVWMDWFQ